MSHLFPLKQPQNIIVRMPNWLGDLVMATPVLQDLKKHWPDATITAMCQSNVALLLREDPNVDELFVFSRPSSWFKRNEHRKVTDQLKKGKYDLGILLTNSFSSAWMFWQGGVQNRLGFGGNCRGWMLNKPMKRLGKKEHLVITYKRLLEPMGVPLSSTAPKLHVAESALLDAQKLLGKYDVTEDAILVGVNPGAAYGSAKCWLPDRFRSVTQKLLENPRVHVLYFGDSVGKPLVDQICSAMPKRVINLAALTSLQELIALIKKCDIFLTNDSGPMHIGSALGSPLVALFGSTDAEKTGPYNGGVVVQKKVDCSPCFKRTCPIDFRCMTRIEVDDVYSELCKLLKP